MFLHSLGEGAVEKVISGKHYNRTIRILKYLYVALVQMQIEKFKEFTDESEKYPSFSEYTSTPEFLECVTEVGNFDLIH